MLDGELDYDEPSAREASAAFEALRDLAIALQAALWVAGGDGVVELDAEYWESEREEGRKRATLP